MKYAVPDILTLIGGASETVPRKRKYSLKHYQISMDVGVFQALFRVPATATYIGFLTVNPQQVIQYSENEGAHDFMVQ